MVFLQESPTEWIEPHRSTLPNVHEGMDVGDIEGDGDLDIATNGYWIQNPGGDLSASWEHYTIDEKWHNQTGDWSKNATKTVCYDVDQDRRSEVLISHSERAGYPLSWYQGDDPVNGLWEEHILVEEIPACHTLQLSDIDQDGDTDILAGTNKLRAQDLGIEQYDVYWLINRGSFQFDPVTISTKVSINGRVADIDNDRDDDIIHLSGHEAKEVEFWENTLQP